MTLATHAVVGGAVASLFPSHPVAAFLAGFFSHFILDAIPHWDYKILSAYANPEVAMSANEAEPGISKRIMVDKNFGLDLMRTGTDALLGVLITLLVWHPSSMAQLQILTLGMVGGMSADFLQFVYMRFPHQPMILIQKFHSFIHTEYRLNDKPFLGIFSQVIFMSFVILSVKFLIKL